MGKPRLLKKYPEKKRVFGVGTIFLLVLNGIDFTTGQVFSFFPRGVPRLGRFKDFHFGRDFGFLSLGKFLVNNVFERLGSEDQRLPVVGVTLVSTIESIQKRGVLSLRHWRGSWFKE